MLRLIAILLTLALAEAPLSAASQAEKHAFDDAAKSFDGHWWDRAEKQFGEFAIQFPNSERKPEAILLQGEARFKLKLYTGVIDLLAANLGKAGAWADQYHYWLAQASFESGNYQAAADAFAKVVNDFPASTNRLEASIGEAAARFNLKDWSGVTNRLRQTNGVFQQAAKARPDSESVVRGDLLLSEALLALKEFKSAEETVQPLSKIKMNPTLDWRRQFLLCRIQRAAGRTAESLASTTNLVALATASGQPVLQAESVAFHAETLEGMNRLAEAVAVYDQNIAPEFPVERRRQALLKVVELSLAQNKIADTISRLEKFLNQYPNDALSDMALLTLGELRLKEYGSLRERDAKSGDPGLRATSTNLLQQAHSHFDRLVTVFTNSEFFGKAQLDRGWCLWEEGKVPESKAAFQSAVEKLPASYDQAVARFKLADAQFEIKDFAGAATNYNLIIDRYTSLPQVKTNLFEPALYQLLRASLATTNLIGATNALTRILTEYPASFYVDRGLLLVGQTLNSQGDPAKARELFSQIEKLIPHSSLLPEVELAIARTYEQEGNWPAAISRYDAWLTEFTNHAARAGAEYSRASANYKAGNETNALTLFTGFVARFPTNDLAPLAQYWVADHYFNAGDFVNAENNAQLLYQNQKWPPSELIFRARMLAGKAAFARQNYSEASAYFSKLINVLVEKTNSPPELLADAYLKLGDTIFEKFKTDQVKSPDDFTQAINAYKRVVQDFPTNLAALALGQIGECCFQLGADDPKRYDLAASYFQQVLTNAYADATVRSQAEVKLAMVFEKQAALKSDAEREQLLELALNRYLNVVYGHNLRGEEKPDLYWLKQAGLAAGNLAEAAKQWEQAVKLYQRMLDLLPPMRTALEIKIKKAEEHFQLQKK
ncbi:MAG: tetratricopeptide repeat protein [Verrucomicrobia bacterium]|nr:tetratricopeptide repeat protein [Verrucomicrobiota bacterium]